VFTTRTHLVVWVLGHEAVIINGEHVALLADQEAKAAAGRVLEADAPGLVTQQPVNVIPVTTAAAAAAAAAMVTSLPEQMAHSTCDVHAPNVLHPWAQLTGGSNAAADACMSNVCCLLVTGACCCCC
jgi:hypothetical protein